MSTDIYGLQANALGKTLNVTLTVPVKKPEHSFPFFNIKNDQ